MSAMTETTTQPTISSVERALDVLELFAEDGVDDLGVTEIAERLGLSKAVVHRILSTYRARGYLRLDPDDRRYSLGARALTLGLAYVDRVDPLGVARSALRELRDRTGETATLSVRVGWARTYIDQVTPQRDIRMEVRLGDAHPLHAGASSKALLAALGDDEVEAYLARGPLDVVTDLTISDADGLRRELAAIRRRGYAVSLGERQQGAGSVAAAIRGRDGEVVAVMSVCGPVDRFRRSVETAAEALLTITGEVTAALGGTRARPDGRRREDHA